MKKFKIHSYKSKKYFWVIVHDTKEEFYKEALQYKKNSGAPGQVKGAGGLFHPYKKWVIKNKKSEKSNDIGIIRLSADQLYPRFVYHEVIHAALWQYRLRHREKSDFGSSVNKREEEFAHTYNELLSRAINGLYKYKLWK